MKISIIELHKENVTVNAHTPEETAAILGVTTRTLAAWRKAETGPEYARVGNAIRYPHEALIDWVSANITLPRGSLLTRARTAQTINDLRGESATDSIAGGKAAPRHTPVEVTRAEG